MSWILAVSGEVSGDQRLQELILGLQACGVQDEFRGLSQAEAVGPIVERGDVSMMGFDRLWQVGWRLARARRLLLREVRRDAPRCAILVDYGGFNLSLGMILRDLGVPVFYYIPPKIWAWGQWRLRRLRRAADLIGPVFAFSHRWYQERGLASLYHGHPAGDRFRNLPDKAQARSALGLDSEEKLLLIMPGSRPGELARHVPVLADTLAQPVCSDLFDRVCMPLVSEEHRKSVETAFGNAARPVQYFPLASPELLVACDHGWMASGTANLEAAWCGLPSLVFYRVSQLTWQIGSRLVKLPYVSPVNLVADRLLYPEFLQDDFCPENLLQWQRDNHTLSTVDWPTATGHSSASPVVELIAGDLYQWLQTV